MRGEWFLSPCKSKKGRRVSISIWRGIEGCRSLHDRGGEGLQGQDGISQARIVGEREERHFSLHRAHSTSMETPDCCTCRIQGTAQYQMVRVAGSDARAVADAGQPYR